MFLVARIFLIAVSLGSLVSSAAMGFAPPTSVVVRPSGEYGVRYAARVGACGPPEGALIVLGTV